VSVDDLIMIQNEGSEKSRCCYAPFLLWWL